jgi:hypothetical protein
MSGVFSAFADHDDMLGEGILIPRKAHLTAVKIQLVSILILLIAGCTEKYTVLENRYREGAVQTNTIILLQDATIFRDVSGKQHAIHLPKSRQMLEWSHEAVARIVTEKGYNVSDRSILSIGLSEKPGTSLPVFEGVDRENPEWTSIDEMDLRQVPIELNATGFDEKSVEVVAELHWGLMKLRNWPPTQGQFFPQLQELDLAPDCLLLVMESVGVQFPTWKKVVEGIVTGVFTFGHGADWDSDNTFHMLGIIDREGVVLWADSFFSPAGGHDSQSDLQKDLDKLFSHLPNHPKKPLSSE